MCVVGMGRPEAVGGSTFEKCSVRGSRPRALASEGMGRNMSVFARLLAALSVEKPAYPASCRAADLRRNLV